MPGQNTHTTSVIERFGGDILQKTLKKVGEESEEEYDEEVEESYDEEEEEGEATLRTERTTNSNLKQKNFTSSSVAVIETTKEEPVFVGV